MKKILGVLCLFIFLFVLTGCDGGNSSEVTCTVIGDTDGAQKVTIIASLDGNGKVSTISDIATFASEEEAKENLKYVSSYEKPYTVLKGNTIEYSNLEEYSSTYKSMIGLNRDEFITKFKYYAGNQGDVTCK